MTLKNSLSIPEELRNLNQWILWRYEDKGGKKPTKVPYSIAHNLASVTDSSTWSSFDEVYNSYQFGKYDGIGFVFTENDPYCFIDLDDTEGNKEALERQQKVFKEFNSYAELSPSGKGLHIIIKGKIPQGRKRSFIEIYSSQRYATMTGNVYSNVAIADRNDLVNELFKQMGGKPNVALHDGNSPQVSEDEKIIEQASEASNGDKFKQLYNGQWGDLYSSQSEADFALIDIIAFYTQNRDQIARLFRNSQLGKRKKAQRRDYLEWMINKSFDRLAPPIDFDGFRIALEEKIANQKSIDNAQQDVNKDNIDGVLRNGSASGFGPEGDGSIPSTPTNDGPVAQRSELVAHNGLVAGSSPAGTTILPPPGLVGEIARFIYEAAPRPVPEIALAAAIGFMAGVCGRAYNISGTGLNQYVLLLANTGCHAKGTKILKYDGSVTNVENIWPGDLLMGPDSKPRKVLNLARGRETMVKIKPIKGEEFIVNLGHILSLVHTKTRERINITVRDYINTHKTFKHLFKLERKAVEFNERNLPLDPWFLGAMLGDGCFGPSIQLTSKDDCILEKALKTIQSLDCKITISQVEGNKAKQHRYSKIIPSNFIGERESKLQRAIKDIGLWWSRSDNKFIPQIYKTSSRQQRMQLLAGILDTDGSLTCNGYDFISKSKQLANDVAYVARSLGLAAYIKQCEKRSQNGSGGVYHRVSISGDCSQLPLVLKYKKAKPRQQKKDVLVTGFTYEVLTEDNYYGFALDGDHLYLTGDFTVHHNTGKESMASGVDKIISAVSLQVPVASEFIGPSEIASGQALVKYVSNKSQSFVSILGEFGKRLQIMADPKANSAEKTLNRIILDLYNKSGHGQFARPSIFADSEKNTNVISSPAFSILAESTPETFYSALSEEMIADGLLPRFMMIEYNGKRPPLNQFRKNEPDQVLVDRVATLMANAKTVMANRSVINVNMTDDAKKMLDDFDKLADNRINNTDKEINRQLWNRAHVKLMKISAIVAVGIQPFYPIVTVENVLWAKEIVESDIKSLSAKFESGIIGRNTDEIKQVNDMKKAISVYLKSDWDKVKSYAPDQRMHSEKIVPHIYLNKKLSAMSSYRNDNRNKASVSINNVVKIMIDGGLLIEASKKQLSEKFGTTMRAYVISNINEFL